MHHDIHFKRVFVLPYQMFCGGCSDHHQRFLSSLGSNETVVFALVITIWVWTLLLTSRARSGRKKLLLLQFLLLLAWFWSSPHSSAKECTCHSHQHRDLDCFDSVRARASFFVVIFLSAGCRDWVVRQMVVIQAPLKMSVFFKKLWGHFSLWISHTKGRGKLFHIE